MAALCLHGYNGHNETAFGHRSSNWKIRQRKRNGFVFVNKGLRLCQRF